MTTELKPGDAIWWRELEEDTWTQGVVHTLENIRGETWVFVVRPPYESLSPERIRPRGPSPELIARCEREVDGNPDASSACRLLDELLKSMKVPNE